MHNKDISIVSQVKTCARCGVEQGVDNFRWHVGGTYRISWRTCCTKDYSRDYYQRNKRRLRESAYQSKYGISIADYDEMLARQGGACAICTTTRPSGHGNRLHVDHDHETGFVRGLLCTKCNRGIGLFNDDPTRLLRGASYLTGASASLDKDL